MNVLEKVKRLQEERGWSTYKLAYEAGLTQSTLSNMFARGTCPTVDTLEKICDAFGISLAEFFEEDVETLSRNLKAMVEPLALIGIGGLVGAMIIALYLPIFTASTSVEGY